MNPSWRAAFPRQEWTAARRVPEYVRDRLLNKHDRTLTRFLDVFNHRLIALFYDAWARNHQGVSFERGGEHDRFMVYVASLIGLGMDSLRDGDRVPDRQGPLIQRAAGVSDAPSRGAEGDQSIYGSTSTLRRSPSIRAPAEYGTVA